MLIWNESWMAKKTMEYEYQDGKKFKHTSAARVRE